MLGSSLPLSTKDLYFVQQIKHYHLPICLYVCDTRFSANDKVTAEIRSTEQNQTQCSKLFFFDELITTIYMKMP